MTQDGDLAYEYDKNGNRTRVTYPGGLQANYTFDGSDRPLTLIASGAGLATTTVVIGATYKPFGPLASATLQPTVVEEHLFDARYFPARVHVPGITDWVYTVDNVGNISTITDGGPPRSYLYQDFQYFLTQGNGPWGTRSWTYDKIGNRLTENRSGVVDTYTYLPSTGGGRNPKLNRITGGIGNRIFSYDAAGDEILLSGPQSEIQRIFDDAGRLTRLTESAARNASNLRYDGRGFLREAKTDWNACTPLGTVPTYSSDGRLHGRRDYSLFTPLVPTREDHILYFAGRPIATIKTAPGSPVVTWVHVDHLGTPILTTIAGPQAAWLGGFEPFGADWSGAQNLGVFLRFPGQWSDGAWSGVDGLYQNVHRWYQLGLGRYDRPDPLGLHRRGGLHALNLWYGYADSSPLQRIDPLGLLATSGCTEDQIQMINEGERSILDSLGPRPECIPCQLGDVVKKKLQTATVNCVDTFLQSVLRIPDYCGWAGDPYRNENGIDITLFDSAFGTPPCGGCFAGQLLHELLHISGCGADQGCAGENAKRCFPCHTYSD